jgi:integrase
MANREVNLTKRVQTTKGWRYCRVVLSANGRVRPDVFLVDGKQETHKESAYYLEWRDGAKRVRLSVGKDPAASARRQRKEAELNAVTCDLVFPTARCNPKLDFLDGLKATAERAKLDKDDFWLYKFRATFATWSLWAGVGLRTVQQWLGHSDMESTMRYLKPSRSQHVRDKVNEIFA